VAEKVSAMHAKTVLSIFIFISSRLVHGMCCESGCESDPSSIPEFLPANQIDVGRFQLVLGEGLV
jgi:hypothetical protein